MLQTKQTPTCVERNRIANSSRAIDINSISNMTPSKIRSNVFRFLIGKKIIITILLCVLNGLLYSQVKQIGIVNPEDDITNFNYGGQGSGITNKICFEPGYLGTGTARDRIFICGANSGVYMSTNETDFELMNTDLLDQTSISDITVNPGFRDKCIISTGSLMAVKHRELSNLENTKLLRSTGFYSGTFTSSQWTWTKIPSTWHTNNLFLLSGQSSRTLTNDEMFGQPEALHIMRIISKRGSSTGDELVVLIMHDKHDSSNTIIGNESFIFTSTNGGLDWNEKFKVDNLVLEDIEVQPNNGSTYNGDHLFISGSYGANSPVHNNVLFSSYDFGSTWSKIAANSTYFNFGNSSIVNNGFQISFSEANYNALYISALYSVPVNQQTQVTISLTQYDLTSTSYITPLNFTYFIYDSPGKAKCFDVSNSNPDYKLVGSIDATFFNTASGAGTPTNISYIHADIRDIEFYPYGSAALISCDGGVRKVTYDLNTQTYVPIGNYMKGLEVGRYYDVSYSNNKIAVASWDDGYYEKDINNDKWSDIIGGEGMSMKYSKTTNSQYYIGWYAFENIFQGFTGNGPWYRSIRADAYHLKENDCWYIMDNTNRILTKVPSGNFANQSTWFTIPSGAPGFAGVSICRGNTSEAWIALYEPQNNAPPLYPSFIYHTSNADLSTPTWTRITNSILSGHVHCIQVNDDNSNEVFVGMDNGKILHTSDAGITWDIQTLPLDVKSINCFYYIKGSNVLVAGTDRGIIYINPILHTWVELTTFPHIRVPSMDYNEEENKLYAATLGRGLFEVDILCPLGFWAVTADITSDIHWDQTKYIYNSITIKNGGKLTITSNVFLCTGAEIKVEPGGMLILDGGKLGSSCPSNDKMWSGIILLSSPSGSNLRARFIARNGSIIENAYIGIEARDNSVMSCLNSTFKNCLTAIKVNFSTPQISLGSIKNCDFLNTKPIYAFGSYSAMTGISITNSNDISITGCNFINSMAKDLTANNNRGIGIEAYNSKVTVGRSYTVTQGNPCTPPTGPFCVFNQLTFGIFVDNTGTQQKVDVFDSQFLNCGKSIFLKSADKSRIYNNNIVMDNIMSNKILTSDVYIGVDFFESSSFVAEHNTIKFGISTQDVNHKLINQFGMRIFNSDIRVNVVAGIVQLKPPLTKTVISYLFDNSIITSTLLNNPSNLYGIKTEDNNYSLEILCNKFDDLNNALFLTGNIGILGGMENIALPLRTYDFPADNQWGNITNSTKRINKIYLTSSLFYYGFNNFPSLLSNDELTAAPDKCSFPSTLYDYYCYDGRGVLDLGSYLDGGGSSQEPDPLEVGLAPMSPEILLNPNPTEKSTSLNLINFDASRMALLKIITPEGVEVLNDFIKNPKEIFVINTATLQAGLYSIIVVNSIGQKAVAKLIVIKN